MSAFGPPPALSGTFLWSHSTHVSSRPYNPLFSHPVNRDRARRPAFQCGAQLQPSTSGPQPDDVAAWTLLERSVLISGKTEPPYSSPLADTYRAGPGVFSCRGCGARVFGTAAQFQHPPGEETSKWPTFYEALPEARLRYVVQDVVLFDQLVVQRRVSCEECGCHLGHYFRDAPQQPTEDRFCINGSALVFEPTPGGY